MSMEKKIDQKLIDDTHEEFIQTSQYDPYQGQQMHCDDKIIKHTNGEKSITFDLSKKIIEIKDDKVFVKIEDIYSNTPTIVTVTKTGDNTNTPTIVTKTGDNMSFAINAVNDILATRAKDLIFSFRNNIIEELGNKQYEVIQSSAQKQAQEKTTEYWPNYWLNAYDAMAKYKDIFINDVDEEKGNKENDDTDMLGVDIDIN